MESDDAWERDTRIIAMVHNTTRSKEHECKPPDHFNQTLSRDEDDADCDTGWIEEEAHRNGQQK